MGTDQLTQHLHRRAPAGMKPTDDSRASFSHLFVVEIRSMSVVSQMFRESTFTPENVSRLESKLFFDGVKRRRQLEQFWLSGL